MTDAAPGGTGGLAAVLAAKTAGRLPILLAAAILTLLLVLLGQVSWPAGLVVFGAMAAIILVPRSAASDIGARHRDGVVRAADPALQRVVDALPDPCLVLDGRSVLLHLNDPAHRQFPGLVLGNRIILSMRAPAVTSAIEAVRRTGEPTTVELHQTVPTETWHRTTVAPLEPGNGAGLLVVTMQSLTEERRLEALRTDFVANASHELRTPLTSLLGFIDTLMGPASRDPAAQKKFLEIMRTQAVRMSKLIEDLLSLSRIEMRQHLRPTTTVDIGSLLREVKEGLQTQAAEQGVEVSLDLPADPVVVTGDRDELYEVFENLIDNALKYGADGKTIEVSLGPTTSRQGYDYLVAVTDHGAGIEAEHVPRLTERFYRVDAESSRKKKGTGLGLAIVKHIVTRHRGLMTIRSQPGLGTRVEVLLPR